MTFSVFYSRFYYWFLLFLHGCMSRGHIPQKAVRQRYIGYRKCLGDRMISRRKPQRVRQPLKNKRQLNNPISFPDLKAQVRISSNIHYFLKEELDRSPAYEAFLSEIPSPVVSSTKSTSNTMSKVIPFKGSIIQPGSSNQPTR